MGSNWAPLLQICFYLLCERCHVHLSRSDNNQVDNVEAFNSTSRYLDDLQYIDKPLFLANGRSDVFH